MADPRFSIIVTFYNQREFVEDAIGSALSQGSQLREIIVVDDGSTDGTSDIVARYSELVRVIRSPRNQGAIESRNLGAMHAHGEYLIFLDGDDLLIPDALDVYERIVIARSPTIILGQRIWFTGAPPHQLEAVHKTVEFISYTDLFTKDRPYGTCASSLVVARRAFENVRGWTPGIFHLDTVDYTTKLGCSGRTILICSPPTVLYRAHAGNSVNTVPPFVRMAIRLLAKERAGEYPGGRQRRFDRQAWLGGVTFFWIKRALRAGIYLGALRLVGAGWRVITIACYQRVLARIRSGPPIENL